MLTFAITCLRCDPTSEPVQRLLTGRCAEAVQIAMPRLERKPEDAQVHEHAALGRAIGRALILLGHAESAEELFRRQLHSFEQQPRSFVRWMSSLNHAEIQLVMNRPSRAAQAFGAVADDQTAPIALRIEALAGLASSVRAIGEYRRARQALNFAHTLAIQHGLPMLQHLVEGLLLETAVKQQLCAFDEGAEVSAAPRSQQISLSADLMACAEAVREMPIAAERLKFLASLADQEGGKGGLSRLLDPIYRLQQYKLLEAEREGRVEAALARVRVADGQGAQELLGNLAYDEEAIRKQRYSLEVRYCVSRIYALQGRYIDALRLYKDHVAQVLARLHTELTHLPYLRCLEHQELLEQTDADKLLLPLRYRRAYQYILEHLNDRKLSVREVAAHVDVSERALQMAFRRHLGMSPAQLIRRRRVERIRKDLRQAGDQRKVLSLAQDWGLSTRSSLTQSYRKVFQETPSTTLRGGSQYALAASCDNCA